MRLDDLRKFYAVLSVLEQKLDGARTLRSCSGRSEQLEALLQSGSIDQFELLAMTGLLQSHTCGARNDPARVLTRG